jgi:hypothetical protein
MAKPLFSLHLSRHIKGFGKPSVSSVEAGLVGHYVDGVPYKPSHDDVRNCLPHYYRAAFDRARVWWFDKDNNDATAYTILTGSRGKYLNTIYAIPYQYKG